MIWNKLKCWLALLGGLFLYLIGYQKGKAKKEREVEKGTIDAIKKAKKSRNSLYDPDRIKRLQHKYKR